MMKKLLAILVAAVLAVTTSFTTAQPAQAFWPWWAFALVAGAALGTGAVIANDYNHQYSDTTPAPTVDDSHMTACQARYRSYDATSDTFLGRDGARHLCRL